MNNNRMFVHKNLKSIDSLIKSSGPKLTSTDPSPNPYILKY